MRWDEQKVENAEEDGRLPGFVADAVVRTFDAPEAMGINFHEVRAKSALNHVPGMPYGFEWTVNVYRGCSHACVYCFARRTHTYLDLNAAEDFEREIVVKVNAPEVLRVELARGSWKRDLVAMGTNTDPYQWVESRYRLTREVLEALRDFDTPVSVLTKSPLALRDLDLYREMAKRVDVSVSFSVPTLEEKAWRETEPHTPHPRARLEAMAEFRRNGIRSGIMVAPLMPGINDAPEQVEPILKRAKEADATFIGSSALHLRGEVKDVFFGWLRNKRPDLVPRYEEVYARGAYLPPAERTRLSGLVSSGGGVRSRDRAQRRRKRERGSGDRTPGRAAGPRQPKLF